MTPVEQQHAAIIGWIEEREAKARAAETLWHTALHVAYGSLWEEYRVHIAAWSPAVTLPLLALLRQQADEAADACARSWSASGTRRLAALYAATVAAREQS